MDLTPIIEDIFSSTSTEESLTLQARNVSTNISSKAVRLVDVVEALGPKLTSLEVQDRVKAMEFLSHVFTFLKSDFLSEKELTFIVEFLHDRLKDQHVVIPKVFLCILPIIRSKNLPEGSTAKLLNQLFQEGNIQSHTHKHRRAVFQTFQHCILHRLEELKKLSSTDFVMNFLQSMDGEKDPRNLLVLFQCIPVILMHFPLGPFVEDFFEVLSCYFPIDFKPSIPGPGGEVITREDLAQSLHKCLSQTNQFCQLLIPLLMEKLDSSIIDAKLDSLQLLGMCCERSYTAEDMKPFLPTIWHALRREIFMGGNEIVETACINFLRFAFQLLAKNPDIMEPCVTMIFTECRHHLSEPELRLSQPTARILTAIAEGSQESCRIVLRLTVPLLHEQFTVKPMSSVRKGLLNIMTTLISTLRLYPSVKLSTTLSNWDEVLAMWFTLLTHSDHEFTILALQFFTKLLNNSLTRIQRKPLANIELSSGIPNVDSNTDEENLSKRDRTLLQEHLLSLLTRTDVSSDVRSSTIFTMGEIAKSYGEEFVEISIPKILPLISSEDEGIQQSALNALAECSVYPIVAESVIPHLLGLEKDSELDEKIVLCLASIVEKGCDDISYVETAKDFTNYLWKDLKFLEVILRVSLTAKQHTNETSYLNLSRIVRILVRSAGTSIQQDVINGSWNNRVTSSNGDCSFIADEIPPLLLESLLGSVRPSVEILQRNQLMDVLLSKITTIPSAPEDIMGRHYFRDQAAMIRLYAVLLNKANDADFPLLLSRVESVIDGIFYMTSTYPNNASNPADVNSESSEMISEPVKEKLNSNSLNINSPENIASKCVMIFFTTVVKTLAMRGITNLDKWIEKTIQLLGDHQYGFLLSNEFSTLLSDCPFSLNAKSFCNFRFLYKQRIFLVSVPKLVAAYGETSKDSNAKANYMRALSSQLKHVPGPVLQMQIDKVFPLLIASLSVESGDKAGSNVEILLSTLIALRDFFMLKSCADESDAGRTTLIEYFHDMAPRLMLLTAFQQNMDVRILALKCLQCCAKLPAVVVLPLKPTVVACLKSSLDDPKRLVRKEAVVTRNLWILVGAPGGL